MSELPLDIIYDILSRMPLRSLARFRCVSKLWNDYIRDPQLEIMHAKRADPNIIMFHPEKSSPNCKKSFSHTEFMTRPDEARKSFYTVVEMTKNKSGTIEFLSQEPGPRWYDHQTVQGSCNGLIYYSCGTHRVRGHTIMAVINPIKKECYNLPPLGIYRYEGSSYGLGFDDSTNTFKMVCIALRELRRTSSSGNLVCKKVLCTMVHVLGSKSWRRVRNQVPSYLICGEGVFAHGVLHWLVSDSDNWRTHNQRRPIILFDIRKEEFGLTNVPKQKSSNSPEDRLFNLNGQVGFVSDNIDNFSMEVWVLNHTEWVMQCQFDKAPPLPRHCIELLGVWNEDGDILITYLDRDRLNGELFVYGLKSGYLLEANYLRRAYRWVKEMRMYQSSLFSIHYSFKNLSK